MIQEGPGWRTYPLLGGDDPDAVLRRRRRGRGSGGDGYGDGYGEKEQDGGGEGRRHGGGRRLRPGDLRWDLLKHRTLAACLLLLGLGPLLPCL